MSAEDADGGEGSASRIYVGNLIPKANEVHLKKLFVRFGVIHNIWIARKPPGFAFVSYESAEGATRAVEAFDMMKDGDHAMEILGKPVKVQMAGDKEKKKSTVKEAPAHKSSNTSGVKKQPVKDKKRCDAHQGTERKENGVDKERRRSPGRRLKRSRSPTRSSKSSDEEALKHRALSPRSSSRGRRRRRRGSRSSSHHRNKSRSASPSRRRKQRDSSRERRPLSKSSDRESRRYHSRSRSRESRRRSLRRSASRSRRTREHSIKSVHSRSSSPSWK